MENKIDNHLVDSLLRERFPEDVLKVEESYGMLDFTVKREKIIDILQWLRDHTLLQFNFLTSMNGMHFPDNKNQELGMVYHLHSFINNVRIRLHIYFPISDPHVPTASGLWKTANWMEREAFDFFGIRFTGHPDLRRILNMEDMLYHPLLKQYPLEDGTRTDKEDKYFGR